MRLAIHSKVLQGYPREGYVLMHTASEEEEEEGRKRRRRKWMDLRASPGGGQLAQRSCILRPRPHLRKATGAEKAKEESRVQRFWVGPTKNAHGGPWRPLISRDGLGRVVGQ